MEERLTIPSSEARRLDVTEKELANMVFSSMETTMKNMELEDMLGAVVMEVMTIKMGGNA